MTRNVFEGLTSVDVDGQVIPTLAESWDVSDDGLTYTFHLQPDVTFHDGTPLTADDVVWSISEAIGPESKSARKSDLLVIEQATAVDDATVELDLSRPSQGLTFYLASVTIVKDGDTELTSDNGTGPYRFVEWVQGDHLTIERNDGYWGEPAQNAGRDVPVLPGHDRAEQRAADRRPRSGRSRRTPRTSWSSSPATRTSPSPRAPAPPSRSGPSTTGRHPSTTSGSGRRCTTRSTARPSCRRCGTATAR
ncbi:hypothetical protein JS562_52535, partial [Agrobacterium sp. S2]|nr:hypothetical protein [Agrobacterium sp. S2]